MYLCINSLADGSAICLAFNHDEVVEPRLLCRCLGSMLVGLPVGGTAIATGKGRDVRWCSEGLYGIAPRDL